MHDTCALAGLPLEPSKTQGPVPRITFLGIELSSTNMEIQLPQDKLTHPMVTQNSLHQTRFAITHRNPSPRKQSGQK